MKGQKYRNTLTKLEWSKGEYVKGIGWVGSGWKRVPMDEKQYKAGLHRAYIREEFDSPETTSEMDLYQEVQNNIQYGPIGTEIDKLPSQLKTLTYDPDTWHVGRSNKLFKIVDPISQVYEYGEWGSDLDDADADTLKERVGTTRLFLEQSGLIQPNSERLPIDILGPLSEDSILAKEVSDRSNGIRANIDIASVSVVPREDGVFNIVDEEDECEEIEFQSKDPRLTNTAMPELAPKLLETIKEIKDNYDDAISYTQTDEELLALELEYEQQLERAVSPSLTFSLNSPFCGRGYSSPGRRYNSIHILRPHETSAAGENRKAFFRELFDEASSCSSIRTLFGRLTIDERKTIDGESNPNYKSYHRPGGFYGKIRSMYAHDKDIISKWSIEDYIDKNGDVHISAFNQARNEYIKKWRGRCAGDEESLRVAVRRQFDRVAGEIPAKYNEKGEKISDRIKWPDSIWRQNRTKAFKELFLTMAQWNAIYKVLSIIRSRIKLNYYPTEERDQTISKLANDFRRIDNLQDLNMYMEEAKRRTSRHKLYDFNPSLIDQISMIDETRWLKSCAKKNKHLRQRFVIFCQMQKSIQSIHETDLEETSIPCYDPRCQCMGIGKPKFAKLQKDKGMLFVECDGCGKAVWIANYKEPIILQTLEEATHVSNINQ